MGLTKLADFEGLIRQALARQNAADPAVRKKVYQSSRNALARMIVGGGAQSPSAIQEQRQALENSIQRIEAGYTEPFAPQTPELPPEITPEPQVQPPIAETAGPEEVPAPPAPEPGPEYPEEDHPIYENPSSGRGRIIAIAAFVTLLAVIVWLVYSLVTTILGPDSDVQTQQNTAAPTRNGSEVEDGDQASNYITILSPADTSTLQTVGRGRAEIVKQSNLDMIRLTSLRDVDDRSTPAEPILLEVSDGVLDQIAGQRVFVEILAKSGSTGPAVFAVGCTIAGVEVCGRKRFRIGLQPEAIVFPIDVPQNASEDASAFLTVNTDITSSASLTGEGDAVDLLYARLRLQPQ